MLLNFMLACKHEIEGDLHSKLAMMRDQVWLLWFEQERENGEDTELLIGVYRTEKSAQEAISRMKDQPGFKDYPEGFRIHSRLLDAELLVEGIRNS